MRGMRPTVMRRDSRCGRGLLVGCHDQTNATMLEPGRANAGAAAPTGEVSRRHCDGRISLRRLQIARIWQGDWGTHVMSAEMAERDGARRRGEQTDTMTAEADGAERVR
jgi:hypothetical protein